jgi:hypothetical protein
MMLVRLGDLDGLKARFARLGSSVRTLRAREACAVWLAAGPLADRRDGMTAVTCAPPGSGHLVVPGVSAQPVDGAYRPCRAERVHERVLRVFGHATSADTGSAPEAG